MTDMLWKVMMTGGELKLNTGKEIYTYLRAIGTLNLDRLFLGLAGNNILTERLDIGVADLGSIVLTE